MKISELRKIIREELQSINEAKMVWWDVFLNGKEIDSVPYVANMSASEVKESLINHDGYDPNIIVKAGK